MPSYADVVSKNIEVDKTGRVRQSGTLGESVKWIYEQRRLCERDLFSFCTIVLGRHYLTESLHAPVSDWLMNCPPYRKLLLLPRGHAKTSLVSHGLPLHLLIQPKEHNVYLPGRPGCDTRIMLAGEVETRATDNMRVLRNALEQNNLLRGWWPDHVWENPRRDASKWNEKALVLPRNQNYPDPSIRAIGVGGAITGARHDVHIKDDLISQEAANSEIVMQTAIDWHRNTRALFDNQDTSLEFIIGTRWAVQDVYSNIMQNDPTVEHLRRSVIEGGVPIYPEQFSLEKIEELRQQFGPMFALMYMNSIGDPSLVDFVESDLRFFTLNANIVEFAEDGRDVSNERFMKHIPGPFDNYHPQKGQGINELLEDDFFRSENNRLLRWRS